MKAKGIVSAEVIVLKPELFLNTLWKSDIEVINVKRVNITTLLIDFDYKDYDKVVELVNVQKGKIKILNKRGTIFVLKKIKKKKILVIGAILIVLVIYFLSTFIWKIQIRTEGNISPYEIRKNLKNIGISGILRKSDINVYRLEKKIEDINKDVLWIRIRIEGSTLKIKIREKVNPPILKGGSVGDCVAERAGEIRRIFVNSGTAKVKPGDIVKEGDVLIAATQGMEGQEYSVPSEGVVIANTFYEKIMEVQKDGTILERTGNRDKDVYIKLFHAKIYLKKTINKYKYYDKIEYKNGFYNQVFYYEKREKKITKSEDEIIKDSVNKLEKSLKKSLRNDADIIDKNITVEDVGNGRIRIKVMFCVKQNIAMVITG